jgi:hypothetical protein
MPELNRQVEAFASRDGAAYSPVHAVEPSEVRRHEATNLFLICLPKISDLVGSPSGYELSRFISEIEDSDQLDAIVDRLTKHGLAVRSTNVDTSWTLYPGSSPFVTEIELINAGEAAYQLVQLKFRDEVSELRTAALVVEDSASMPREAHAAA